MKVEGQTTGILEEKLKLEAEVGSLKFDNIDIYNYGIRSSKLKGGLFEGAA